MSNPMDAAFDKYDKDPGRDLNPQEATLIRNSFNAGWFAHVYSSTQRPAVEETGEIAALRELLFCARRWIEEANLSIPYGGGDRGIHTLDAMERRREIIIKQCFELLGGPK